MAEGQKIWFVYLSDHHEGPFTPAEVAEKAAQGLVNGKSLVWKDGMAEWAAAETIREIQAVLNAPAPAAPQAAALASDGGLSLDLGSSAPAADGGEQSLAQMLSQSQAAQPAATLESNTASLALDMDSSAAPAPDSAPLSVSPAAASAGEPAEHEQVWTMRSGNSVSGLFTMQTLKEMAASGQVPADAHFWYSGITDFLPLASFPMLQAMRKEKKAGTQTGITARPRGLAPITAAADVGQEPDTDPTLKSPAVGKPGFLEKFKGFFTRKKSAPAAAPAAAKTKTGTTLVSKKIAPKRKFSIPLLRPLLMLVGVGVVAGGGAAVYLLFLSSPIPEMEDVTPTDLEQMRATAKASPSQGGKLLLVRAVGDDVTPTYYVATNLSEGASVQMEVEGVPGTLVNAIQMKKSFAASVDKRQLAVFAALADEGKPLPMGDYNVTVTAAGAEPLKQVLFVGGPKKNHIYERRMGQYKEKLQAAYDKEMQEMKEFITTARSLYDEATAKIARNMTAQTAAQRGVLVVEWDRYGSSYSGMISQMRQKLKEASAQPDRIYPEELKQLDAVLAKMTQLWDEERNRLIGGNAPSASGASMKTDIESMEKWLAEAVMKAPLEVLAARAKQPPAATATAATPETGKQ